MGIIKIQLNRGLYAIIDEEDHHLVCRYSWHSHIHKSGHIYARTNITSDKGGKRQERFLMHRLILGLTDPRVKVDHRNGDGLDNTRMNLRKCSVSQNGMNRGAQRNSSTGVKGVSPCGKGFAATITIGGKQKHLGVFETVESAREAHDKAALVHHGVFANLSGTKAEVSIPTPQRRSYRDKLVFNGTVKSGAEWAVILGISTSAIYRRLEKHGSIEAVIKNSDSEQFKRMVEEATGIPTTVEG